MKILKFFIAFAALYVLGWIFFLGVEALWAFCIGLGSVLAYALLIGIFCLLPGLLMAWAIFKW